MTIPDNNDNPHNQDGDNNSHSSYGSYNSDSGDENSDGGYASYSDYQAATGASSTDEGAQGIKDIGTWTESLVPEEKQNTLGMISLMLSIFLGIVGMFPAGYYLYYLDDSVEKTDAAKLLNKFAFFIPIVLFVVTIAFLIFMSAMTGVLMSRA